MLAISHETLGVRFPTLVHPRLSCEPQGSEHYRNAVATAASVAGNDQAQSPRREMAAAATTQPTRKPNRRSRDLFKRPASTAINGRPDNTSISDRTVLVKLPVITAVEIAPGIAKRSRVY